MKCQAKTKTGKPCKANAIAGSDYCVTHSRLMDQKPEAAATSTGTSTAEAKPQIKTSPSYIKSEPTVKAQSWEKEEYRMDEKKNIPFIPGLALILAVLALALIAVNSMNSTPSMEAMEKAMDSKITAVENAIVAQVKSGEMINSNVNFSLLNRDLNNLLYSLDRVNVEPGSELDNDVVALKDAALKLQAKLAPKAKTE